MFKSAGNILLCLHYGIGDVIMQMPILKALRGLAGQARITALGADPALELLEDSALVDARVSIQRWGLKDWYDPGDPEIRKSIRAWLQKENFDLVLDASHAVRAFKEEIESWAPMILDTDLGSGLRGRSGAEALRDAVRNGWRLPLPDALNYSIPLGDPRLVFAQNYLRCHGTSDKAMIGISPVASSFLKRWPLAHLADAAERLWRSSAMSLLVFSGPQVKTSRKLTELMNHVPHHVVGPVHLLDTVALLKSCSVLICNDTGLMHMAAAVGTPVVAVFGPTSARIYSPRADNAAAACTTVECPYRKEDALGPSPCIVLGRCLIDLDGCIQEVSAQTVFMQALQLLKSEKG